MREGPVFISNGSPVTVKTPLSLTTSSFFTRPMPPMSGRSWPSAYARIYERQMWVYVVVNKLAAGTARLPLPVYLRDDKNRPRKDDHPMAKLLQKPNPALSPFDFWFWVSAVRDVFGEAPVYKRRQGGTVVGLYPLHPTGLQENQDGTWRFDNGSLVLESIAPNDLMMFKHFHPTSMTRGLSPLEPLRDTMENEWHARTAMSSFWQRGARPGMALAHPGQLSPEAGERLRQQFDDSAAGSGNTGRTVVLEEGMTPHPLMITAEDAQYVETRKMNREEACAVYDVPPPAVHILDHATFSNITEQLRSVYRDTQAPRLKYFESVVEQELRAVEWPNDDVYAEFLMDEVLRGDFETRQEALGNAKYMTIAEKRKIENLPFIEGTDRIFLNAADVPMVPPTSVDAPAAPPFQQVGLPALIAAGVITRDEARELVGIPGAAPEAPPADDTQALPVTAVRSVMGRLSWQKSLDQVDAEALVDGLDPWDASAVMGAVAAEESSGGTVKGLRSRIRDLVSKPVRSERKAAPDLDKQSGAVAETLRSFFARQAEAVGDGELDRERWDAELTDDLHATAVAVSSLIGKAAVRTLGFDASLYDVDRTVDFLRAVAERYAANINETTATMLAVEGAVPAQVFEARTNQTPSVATAVTANIAGFAVVEAGRRVAESDGGTPTKTWVTGSNPRSSHAAMNGETVGIDDTFSNGMEWPGAGGDVDEVAGCNCAVDISYEGGS